MSSWLLRTSLLAACSIVVAQRAAAETPRSAQQEREKAKVRLDRYGDPLPPGAIARLGTARFRQGFFVHVTMFSPDGKTIVCTAAGRGLCLWDAASGKELRRFGTATHANAVAFSPDGKTLASQDKGVPALYDAASGEMLGHLAEAKPGVAALAFAPDGKTVASARYNDGFSVWDVDKTRKSRKRFDQGEPKARCLAFSPDGETLATGGEDKILYLWDAATGKELGRMIGHEKEVSSVAFCADGRTLASASDDQTVRLWDVMNQKILRVLDGKHGKVATMNFAPDGKTLASGHSDGTLALWDVGTGKEIRRWRDSDIAIRTVAFSPDGKTLVSGSVWGCGPRLWDVGTGKERGPLGGHHSLVDELAFSSDGKSLLSSGRDKVFLRWDLASGRESVQFNQPIWAQHSYTRSPSGDTVATWTIKDDTIRLWDVATNQERHTLGKFTGRAQAGRIFSPLAFSPDGRLLAFGGTKERKVIVWDVASGKQRQQCKGLSSDIICVAFSRDGKRVAAGLEVAGGRPTIALWDVDSGKSLGEFASVEQVDSLAFSPDGKVLASGSWQGKPHLWDTATGRELRLLALAPVVFALAFSPDGKWLVGAGADRDEKIHVWEVNTGLEARCFQGHVIGAMSVAFAADGRAVASGGADSMILLWDLTGRMSKGRLQAAKWTPAELEQRWTDLASDRGPPAVQALWDLVASPEQAVPMLRQRIKAVPPVEAKRVERWIGDLDSEDFATRTKATEELEKIVDAAEPALRKKLTDKPSLEVRQRIRQVLSKLEPLADAERLRVLRAIQVLEYAATPEAKECLRTLAKGVPAACLTREAKAAMGRLAK